MHRNFNGRNQHVKLSHLASRKQRNSILHSYWWSTPVWLQFTNWANEKNTPWRRQNDTCNVTTWSCTTHDYVQIHDLQKNKLGEITIKEICTRLAGNIYMVKESMQHSHKCWMALCLRTFEVRSRYAKLCWWYVELSNDDFWTAISGSPDIH